MTPIEIFNQSGFEVPADLAEAVEAAADGIAVLGAEGCRTPAKVRRCRRAQADDLRNQAAAAIVAGKPSAALEKRALSQVQAQAEAGRMPDQLEALVPAAEKALQAAQETVSRRIQRPGQPAHRAAGAGPGRTCAKHGRQPGWQAPVDPAGKIRHGPPVLLRVLPGAHRHDRGPGEFQATFDRRAFSCVLAAL